MRTIEVVMAQIPNGGSNLLCLALARIAGQNTIVGIRSRLTARDPSQGREATSTVPMVGILGLSIDASFVFA